MAEESGRRRNRHRRKWRGERKKENREKPIDERRKSAKEKCGEKKKRKRWRKWRRIEMAAKQRKATAQWLASLSSLAKSGGVRRRHDQQSSGVINEMA
jgi:hypothetical protein